MKEYKYIGFVALATKTKTFVWGCITISGFKLGIVKWYGAWRQYCYYPAHETGYSAGCLDDISDFIKEAMKARKEE